MAPFVTRGFHHPTLVSADVRRTLRFYRDLLGLRLVKQTVDVDDPTTYHLYLASGDGRPGTLLGFLERRDARRGHWGVGGIHHIALSTRDLSSQLRWKRRLMDAGLPVSGPYDRGYFHSLYFQDPDGHILEIATEGPGYHFDEPAGSLGERFIRPEEHHRRKRRSDTDIHGATHPEPVPEICEEMGLNGVHHVTGITNDLEAADSFYREALGLRLIKRTVNQDDETSRHYFWANYDGRTVLPGSSMTLFGWPATSRPARPGSGQTHHLAFRVGDEDEQRAWREHLLWLGLPVTEIRDRHYFKSIYFAAPDGLLIELATDGPGFSVDEPSADLGTRLQLPPWLEADRERIAGALAPLD